MYLCFLLWFSEFSESSYFESPFWEVPHLSLSKVIHWWLIFFWWSQISLNVLGAFGHTLMPGQWRTGYLFQSLQPGLVCVSPYLKHLQKFSILIIDFTKTTVNSALEGTLSSSLLWLLQPEVHGPDELGEDKDTDSPMATTADVTSKAHSLPDRHITGAHSRITLAVACLPLNFIEAGPEASFVATVQVCVFLRIRSFCPLFSESFLIFVILAMMHSSLLLTLVIWVFSPFFFLFTLTINLSILLFFRNLILVCWFSLYFLILYLSISFTLILTKCFSLLKCSNILFCLIKI